MTKDFLYITQAFPDDKGGGTEQRAATNLRGLCGLGRVHLLRLGRRRPRGPAPDLSRLLASETYLGDIVSEHSKLFRSELQPSLVTRLTRRAWALSGILLPFTTKQAKAIRLALPVQRFGAIFAFQLTAACVARSLGVAGANSKWVLDWDFLESPNVVDWAKGRRGGRLSPLQWIAARFNQAKVRRIESNLLRTWDIHLCSSELDTHWLARRAKGKIVRSVTNAVSVPDQMPPYPVNTPPTVVYVASLSYWPNADGILHFLDEVWPRVRDHAPDARLNIVGRAPPAAVQSRSGVHGVTVTSDVPSVAPYYLKAHVAIVPLRFVMGSNLKLVEAMAYGRPVVSYASACKRLNVGPESGVFPVTNSAEFADTLVTLLRDQPMAYDMGTKAHAAAVVLFSKTVAHHQLAAAFDAVPSEVPRSA